MGLPHLIYGRMSVTLICADPSHIISLLNNMGILLESVEMKDPVTITFIVCRNDYKKLKKFSEKHGLKCKINQFIGFGWKLKEFIHRPFFLLEIVLMLIMMIYIPGKIFFVRVEGNNAIPTKLIIEKANQCGISFGASRVNVRSEKIKNALMESIPQLQWAGVNTYGSVAVISVKEKTMSDVKEDSISGVSSIVAARDGIIQKITVSSGNPVCHIGQAVKAGQVLVSGYSDCGLSIRASKADAEVMALTDRQLSVQTPIISDQRSAIMKTEKKYAILIGKKLINLYNNSRIFDTGCVKINDIQELTLPGGFKLPVSLLTQTIMYYDVSRQVYSEAVDCDWLSDYAKHYLDSIMIAGHIITSEESGYMFRDIYHFNANYTCCEMIGQVKKEEIIQ